MRKLIPTFAVCFAMAASFVSCGSNDSSSESKKNGIEGKWNMTDDAMGLIKEDQDDLKLISGSIDFKDDNKAYMDVKIDYSKKMSLKDDKFILQDYELDILEFTGTELSVGVNGEEVLGFTRDEKSDDMYGTYDFPQDDSNNDENVEDQKLTVTFEKDGSAYINMTATKPYLYDEETKELKEDENDKDTSKAEIDGDKLTITNSDGKVTTLIRAD